MIFRKCIIAVVFFILLQPSIWAQQKTNVNLSTKSTHPKLVVGLVIDQMRWDYLYKFEKLYSTNGFNRLKAQGFNCDNTLITHLPTYTAVGHTGIYSGSVPAYHGIVGNNWYDTQTGKMVYCTDDTTVRTIGSDTKAGLMSPKNMQVDVVGDELRLSNNFKSKVIGISLKDRGAILPAGHSANAAFWFDDEAGKWISSSYYMDSLPSWVNAYNSMHKADDLMSKDWNTIMPIEKYTLSSTDNKNYEGTIPGEKTNTFPHQLNQIKEKKYNAFKYTPFANSFSFDFAKNAIEAEKLGKTDVTDFLALSISSTDYIGHTFGPNSIEMEDTYLRLDAEVGSFLQYLDSSFGKGNYLLFLTADHGAANVPGYLNEHQIPGGTFSNKELIKEINDSIAIEFKISNAVVKIENAQLYLNPSIKNELGNDNKVINKIIEILISKPYVSKAFHLSLTNFSNLPDPINTAIANSYFKNRSGDIQIILSPNYFDGGKTGTTHGLWNPYDAHIPLIWFGWNIKSGRTNHEIHMTDIAATLSAILHIQMPNGCIGKVIEDVTK